MGVPLRKTGIERDMELKLNGNKIFAPLKNKELVLTPEERVRQEYICRLANHYGYDLSQIEQELQVTVRLSLPSTLHILPFV